MIYNTKSFDDSTDLGDYNKRIHCGRKTKRWMIICLLQNVSMHRKLADYLIDSHNYLHCSTLDKSSYFKLH